jgi:acyl carrier protein
MPIHGGWHSNRWLSTDGRVDVRGAVIMAIGRIAADVVVAVVQHLAAIRGLPPGAVCSHGPRVSLGSLLMLENCELTLCHAAEFAVACINAVAIVTANYVYDGDARIGTSRIASTPLVVNGRGGRAVSDAERGIRRVIALHLGEETASAVTMETQFDELGDSLDAIELLLDFEEEVGCEIPDDDVEEIRTIGDAIGILERALASKPRKRRAAAPAPR